MSNIKVLDLLPDKVSEDHQCAPITWEDESTVGPSSVLSKLHDAPVPETAVIPPGWDIGPGGIFRIEAKQDRYGEIDLIFKDISPHPVVISGRRKHLMYGTEYLDLSWARDGMWHHLVAPREQIASSSAITRLAGRGFPVTTPTARHIVSYLSAYEGINLPNLPTALITTKLGWQGDAGSLGFMWGRTLIDPEAGVESSVTCRDDDPLTWNANTVFFRTEAAGDDQIVDAYNSKGSYNDWCKAVALVAEYPRVMLALYASLGAPMLEILDVPNFIIDWSYTTSTGKSTTLRLAASCWGNPNENSTASVMGTWDATPFWIECTSALASGMPVILDDTKRAKTPKFVAEMIYHIAQGKSRARGSLSGIVPVRNFHTIMLSSGETRAIDFTEDGGTRARVITLWGSPFGDSNGETAKKVMALNEALKNHYGHAGPRVAQYLLADKNSWEDWRDDYLSSLKYYTEKAENELSYRKAQYLALLDTSTRIAHEALDLPWENSNPVDEILSELLGETCDGSLADRAIALVVSYLHSNVNRFVSHQIDGKIYVPAGSIWGRWDAGDDWEFVAVYPHILQKLLDDNGMPHEAVVRLWRERGWLQTDGKRFTKSVRILQDVPRMYVIDRSAFESIEDATDEQNI